MGKHVDLVIGAVAAIVTRSTNEEWKLDCYSKVQAVKVASGGGDVEEDDDEDDSASWGDVEQAFCDKLKVSHERAAKLRSDRRFYTV